MTAGSITLVCAAFDVSVTGVRLCLFNAAQIPKRVLLRLHDGVVRIGCCRWQRDVQVGVEFDSQYEDPVSLKRYHSLNEWPASTF